MSLDLLFPCLGSGSAVLALARILQIEDQIEDSCDRRRTFRCLLQESAHIRVSLRYRGVHLAAVRLEVRHGDVERFADSHNIEAERSEAAFADSPYLAGVNV